MGIRNKRPVYLDLLHIKLPVPALTSLLHRASGMILFLAFAPVLLLFQRSLQSADSFASVQSLLLTPAGSIALVLLAWALAHHTLAGLRALCLDVHCGTSLPVARWSAHAVNGGGVLAALLVAGGCL